MSNWFRSYRCDPLGRVIADRHYNRQTIGAPNFVPPGRCLVFRTSNALWVTSFPYAQYVKHAWAGAWVNSLFRNEGDYLSSKLILDAISHTRYYWQPPPLGMITFVNPKCVPGVMVRGVKIFGFCYKKAGFQHVGFTKGGLWAWQLLPDEMPPPIIPLPLPNADSVDFYLRASLMG